MLKPKNITNRFQYPKNIKKETKYSRNRSYGINLKIKTK